MKLKLLFQLILSGLLVVELCQLAFRLQAAIEESAEYWQQDYTIAFCARYLAWQRNWQASHEWLETVAEDEQWLEAAKEVAKQEQFMREQNWDEKLLASCRGRDWLYEVYFQSNPTLKKPYPNWTARLKEPADDAF